MGVNTLTWFASDNLSLRSERLSEDFFVPELSEAP